MNERSVTGYTISTDRTKLDLPEIHRYLSNESYWAQGRTLRDVERSVSNSLCFGVFDSAGRQAGFARVVTDYVTFGWLADVFILQAHRGKGLAKWLVETVVSHPDLRGLKRLVLGTRDAHELYRKYGQFSSLRNPERWMQRDAMGAGAATTQEALGPSAAS